MEPDRNPPSDGVGVHGKLVFQIYSVTQEQIIIQKELFGWPIPSVRYMKWFGPHLVVILEKGNNLSMMSWQPGLASFLPCPLNVEMERRSSPGDGGGAEWAADAADCVHVDYGGDNHRTQVEWGMGFQEQDWALRISRGCSTGVRTFGTK